jgi:hypothetical protein
LSAPFAIPLAKVYREYINFTFIFTFQVMLSFKDVKFLLVYLPVDSSFLISSVEDTSWNEECYDKIVLKNKVKVQIDYDDQQYGAVVMQCACISNHLEGTQAYLFKVKNEKHLPVERLLPLIPRFTDGRKRPAFTPLKVV